MSWVNDAIDIGSFVDIIVSFFWTVIVLVVVMEWDAVTVLV